MKNTFIDGTTKCHEGRWSVSWRRMLWSLDSNPSRSTHMREMSLIDWLVAIVKKNCENYEKNILIDANGDDDTLRYCKSLCKCTWMHFKMWIINDHCWYATRLSSVTFFMRFLCVKIFLGIWHWNFYLMMQKWMT